MPVPTASLEKAIAQYRSHIKCSSCEPESVQERSRWWLEVLEELLELRKKKSEVGQ